MTTVPADKWNLDEAQPACKRLLLQKSVEEAKNRPASRKAKRVAAVYKRAALASGFKKKTLPDGTMTIESVKQPDFAEFDRCLGELSDLGVEPVGLTADHSDETLPEPARSPARTVRWPSPSSLRETVQPNGQRRPDQRDGLVSSDGQS
jgi:hypothetical protein